MDVVKIAKAIGVLNRTFQSYISKSLADKDVSYSESIFMVNINHQPGMSQEDLSEILAIDKGAVARAVKSLEEKGYIRTENSVRDKRAKALYLTDTGKIFIQFMDSLHQTWIDHVMHDMSEDVLETFTTWIDLMGSRAKAFRT